MTFRYLFRLASVVAPLCVALASACSSEKKPSPPLLSIPCAAAEVSGDMDPAADVHVFVDEKLPEQVKSDVGAYLSRVWKLPVAVSVGTAAGQPGDAIWIS